MFSGAKGLPHAIPSRREEHQTSGKPTQASPCLAKRGHARRSGRSVGQPQADRSTVTHDSRGQGGLARGIALPRKASPRNPYPCGPRMRGKAAGQQRLRGGRGGRGGRVSGWQGGRVVSAVLFPSLSAGRLPLNGQDFAYKASSIAYTRRWRFRYQSLGTCRSPLLSEISRSCATSGGGAGRPKQTLLGFVTLPPAPPRGGFCGKNLGFGGFGGFGGF